ncbi:sulfate ABC transporter substrate-binding protein [Hydrocarboniphaga sp.]|uniref:sulfate ABC transporter substrate-binding protein n=1 Tax=Hydrocarboniphaga sp. TaxID=2033016 RepID=UPI003D12C698
MTIKKQWLTAFGATALLGLSSAASAAELLNVSYDVARTTYQDFNPAFIASWKAKTGETLKINQSHGGSSKQARAVIDGLDADVVTMNNPLDIDVIAEKAALLPKDWAKQYPNHSSPSWSPILFVVRKGNPKNIRDWADLVKPGVSIVMPNPKTSGNGRYSYLAAFEWAKKAKGGEDGAQAFVTELLGHVPVLDTGGRGATTTFSQRGIGDVLLTFENEVALLKAELGDKVETVLPSLTVRADNPIALVQKVAAKKGNTDRARAYLDFHFTPQAQEIFAHNDLRPVDEAILAKYPDRFPQLNIFRVEDVYGSWAKAQKQHFADGASFDQIYAARR